MSLSTKQINDFRSRAHHLKPVVLMGDKGLTPNVMVEVKQALFDHELIKVKAKGEKADIKVIAEEICEQTGANLIQIIGRIIILYCKSDK